MISLKKFIDSNSVDSEAVEPVRPEPGPRDQDSASLLFAYQAALAAMGVCGQRAVPVLGDMIHSALARIGESLSRSPSPAVVLDSRVMVEQQLNLWADRAQQNLKESEQTIRDLLLVVFEATESTGIRDEKFTKEIIDLSNRLRTIAGLDSLPLMRRSITENAGALASCVKKMADEGRESVRKLTSEIAEYQTRLVASERRALVDALTGLANRRGFEQQLDLRVQERRPFSLLVADLNGFKMANDRYGHLVGDEILKQFAAKLKVQFLPEDTVARWGGDEFVGIVLGSATEGAVRADRVRHWVPGEYKIAIERQAVSVIVEAAVGTIAWNGIESGPELFARADKEMYRVKQSSRELSRV